MIIIDKRCPNQVWMSIDNNLMFKCLWFKIMKVILENQKNDLEILKSLLCILLFFPSEKSSKCSCTPTVHQLAVYGEE